MLKRIPLITSIVLVSCQSIQQVPINIIRYVTPTPVTTPVVKSTQTRYKKVTCRITYYTPDKKWGSQVAAPGVKKAIQGLTVAAHPDFKFGTKISIPRLKGIMGDGLFVVQDRGSAVTKKKASRGKAYVFDIYLSSTNYLKYYTRLPAYMDVYIAKP